MMTRRAFISARIKGRIDQLMVNYVAGRCAKDPLASIYSPGFEAQQELLLAVRGLEPQKASRWRNPLRR